MEVDEFEYQIKKMASFYGRKLTDAQLDVWFEKVGQYRREVFVNIINQVVENEKTFPTPAQFKKYSQAKVVDNIKLAGCDFCKGTGFVEAEKVGSESQPYAFRCDCAKGMELSKHIPEWRGVDVNAYKKIDRLIVRK